MATPEPVGTFVQVLINKKTLFIWYLDQRVGHKKLHLNVSCVDDIQYGHPACLFMANFDVFFTKPASTVLLSQTQNSLTLLSSVLYSTRRTSSKR